jgi:predicted protein tyrosine phosphatase
MHNPGCEGPDIAFHIASLRFADRILADGKWDALISIGHPNGTENCVRRAPRSLIIGMWDDCPYWRRIRGLPTGEHVLKIIDFARSLNAGDRLLVHCKKGRSRSTASLLIVLAARGVREPEAVEALLANAPKATPNGWLLKLGDALLGTDLFHEAWERRIVKWERKVVTA